MALELRKESAAGVDTPAASHVAFFVDENGNPSLKDSNGLVTPAVNAGAPLTLNQQSSAPTAEPDKIKLYAKEVSGATEFFVRDEAGNEVQITNKGELAGGGTFFNSSQSFEDSIAAFTGIHAVNTGIMIPLIDNLMFSVHVEVEGLDNLGGFDVGYVRFLISWDDAPVPPASIIASVQHQTGGNLLQAFDTSDISLNASGELVLTLDAGVDTYQGRLKITVSPGFTRTIPIAGA